MEEKRHEACRFFALKEIPGRRLSTGDIRFRKAREKAADDASGMDHSNISATTAGGLEVVFDKPEFVTDKKRRFHEHLCISFALRV